MMIIDAARRRKTCRFGLLMLAGTVSLVVPADRSRADSTSSGTSGTYQMSSYQQNLIPLEGGSKGFGASGSNGAYLGAFQLSSAALQDAGFKDSSGNWTAKAQSYGVSSADDFLNNPQAQIAADTAYNAKNASYLQSDLGSSYSSYLNSTDKYSGATLSSGALAYCSESLGAAGCANYLKTGTIPADDLADNPSWQNGGWQKNLEKMSNTSLDDSVDATVSTSTTTDSNGNTETATTVTSMYCAPEVKAAMQASSASMLNTWVKVAEMPGTGYTLVNGESVLQAGGGMSSGDPGYVNSESDLYQAGYASVSCIKQIMNTRPMLNSSSSSLAGILQQLASAACNALQTQVSNLTQPVNQSLYKTIDLDGIVPGLYPGSISVGGSTTMSESSTGLGDALLGTSQKSPVNSWTFN